ncbi:MAG: hypothetical protein R3B09_22910 [Nannocystaceae bacterium]
MHAASYLPLLVLVALGGAVYAASRWRRAPAEDAPLVRLGAGPAREEAQGAGLRLLITGGAALLLVLLAAPVIAQVSAPRCEAANGGSPCKDGDPLSPLPLLPPLLIAAPLLVLAARELRSL